MTSLDASPPAGVAVLERQAVRALLVDVRDRLLLFEGLDPQDPERGHWWFTPGGGLEAGENDETGLAREVYEETGFVIDRAALGSPVWWRHAEFLFAGQWYRQSERFYLVRVEGHVVDTSGFQPVEASAILGHAWWTVDELSRTDQVVYPRALSSDLAGLLGRGVSRATYEIS